MKNIQSCPFAERSADGVALIEAPHHVQAPPSAMIHHFRPVAYVCSMLPYSDAAFATQASMSLTTTAGTRGSYAGQRERREDAAMGLARPPVYLSGASRRVE